MRQTLHIFAKDTRRFWPEIAVSLGIAVAFAWIYPYQWRQNALQSGPIDPFEAQRMLFLSGTLGVLLPISWWNLTARVVHAESLVGNRQFWLTRPYEWKKLLGAKALFLFAYLCIPLFVMQAAILLEAGFHSVSYIPGLLYSLWLVSVLLIMPVFAIATVTSNVARITIVIIGVILGGVALLGFVTANVGFFIGTSAPSRSADFWQLPFVFCVCATIAVLQYASRRVWLSRALLTATLCVFLFAGSIQSDSSVNAQLDRDYPALRLGQDAPIRLSFRPDSTQPVTASPTGDPKQVEIRVHLRVSGVRDGHVMIPDHVRVFLQSQSGFKWQSQWQPLYNMHYLPEPNDSAIGFNMPLTVFQRVKASSADMRIVVTFIEAQSGGIERIPIGDYDFRVPNLGICSPLTNWDSQGQITGISCRSALRQPPLTYIESAWSSVPCSNLPTDASTGVQGAGWVGNLENDPAEFGIASVNIVPIPISNGVKTAGDRNQLNEPRFLCPGTPLIFTNYQLTRRVRIEVTIPGLSLPSESKRTPQLPGDGY